jgi:hypothetical protein
MELKKDTNIFSKYGKDAIAVLHVIKLVTFLTKLDKNNLIAPQLSKHISRSMTLPSEENANGNVGIDAMLQEFPAVMPD